MKGREAHFPAALYTAYDTPVHITSAHDHFYHSSDHDEPYLDLYNNVSHVGHSNPEVLAAVKTAYETVNINTRYLHDSLTTYAEHLSTHLPSTRKWRMIFTNSGSEANDLALQMALQYIATRFTRTRLAALEGSYHGTTWLCQQVSHLTSRASLNGTSVNGIVDFVPRTDDVEPVDLSTVGAMIVETIQGVGGNFDLTQKFLRHVRAEVPFLICDEVQTGFGRTGKTFWAFEKAGIVPDVITCGKPIANGYPMGAVIFRADWEPYLPSTYFNTFGGSSAACAAAEAVLHVVEKREVVRTVGELGDWLKEQLVQLPQVHLVTGEGLFLGIQVGDRAHEVVERLKNEFRMLVGLGFKNTIRVKPPTTVTREDLARFVQALQTCLT